MNLPDLSLQDLKRAITIKTKIDNLKSKLARILGNGAPTQKAGNGRRKRRKMSAAARKKIAAAQRARWAKVN
jgi:hypothetical protein